MYKTLINLQKRNYKPDIIFDIGAHKGDWTRECMSVYSDSYYFLFEPIEYNEIKIFNLAYNAKVEHMLLYDKECEVDWYEEQNSGDSIYRENTRHFMNTIPIKKNTITLNNYIHTNNIDIHHKKILIKIDCQGSEIPILQGASILHNTTDFMILEMPFFGEYNKGVPTFLEHIQYMDSIGFIPFDIIEPHYVNGFTMQVDIIFITPFFI